jgi:hypothetical protein
VADVLIVTALKLGNPVPFVVCVITSNRLLHCLIRNSHKGPEHTSLTPGMDAKLGIATMYRQFIAFRGVDPIEFC